MVLSLAGEVATIVIKYNVVTSLMVADNKKHPTAGVVGVGVVENYYSSSQPSNNSSNRLMLSLLTLNKVG